MYLFVYAWVVGQQAITYHVSLINHNVPSEELLYERDGINNKNKIKKMFTM